jgi:hypothetical protein
MTTFSQLVDDIVTELVRPDMKVSITSYVNQTVRELHFKPGLNAPINYDANRIEEELTATTDGTWLWTLPSSTRFQDVEALFCDDLGIYIERRNPRIALQPTFQPYADVYWYRSASQIAITGVNNGYKIRASYFMFPSTLLYKVSTARVVRFDADTDSYVLVAGGGVPTDAQLALETHWMLQRWGESVIKEGVRAKTWKRLGDDGRARMAFSSFESLKASVWNSEPAS